jgi:energy-converting hydrogenase Eha subunit H
MVGTLTCMQWVIYDSFKVACGLATTGGKWRKTDVFTFSFFITKI